MKNEKCLLCGGMDFSVIHKGARGGGSTDVLKCQVCGMIQLSAFLEDSDLFYTESGMEETNGAADFDEITIRRMGYADDVRRVNMLEDDLINKDVLDVGCGAGGFIEKARRFCNRIEGVELERRMREFIAGEGVNCYANLEDMNKTGTRYDLITLFHVLEHMQDPIDALLKLKDSLNDEGRVIIEVPNADDALLSLYDCEEFADFTYWICHLYYFTNDTLRRLIERAGYRIVFLSQLQRYPVSNHLYWLRHGRPGGHEKWSRLNETGLTGEYGKMLSGLGMADTIFAIIEKNGEG